MSRWRWVVVGILILILPCCAGKRRAAEETDKMENGEYLLFLSTVQGNPLCMFGSVQKMRVFPWLTSPRTRWRVHTWLIFPGASRTLFSEDGKRKQAPSVPLTWTKDTLLFTTDSDRFVFFQPFPEDKVLLLTDAIFPDRVRKSGEEEIHYSLLPSSLTWNNQKVEGRLFYQKLEMSEPRVPSTFLPVTGLKAKGRVYAIWVPGGLFLYLEKQDETAESGRSSAAIMQDRRGKWQETYNVTVTEPDHLFTDGEPPEGASRPFVFDIPFWKIQGSLERVQTVRPNMEASGYAGSAPNEAAKEDDGGNRLLWTAMDSLPDTNPDSPVRFCLLKGRLQVEGETQSVYGVGIMEP